MAIEFGNSRTKENLMRAFAGESQARNRYTIAADKAKKQGMFAISEIFKFTANEEKAHAERFYDLLKSESGTTIHIDGGYPVDNSDSLTELLRAARHNEMEEFENVYPVFAKTAREEGFAEIAAAFQQIAQIEAVHGKRFESLAELLGNNRLYESDGKQAWLCLHCGHIYFGKQVPALCPVCRHERGHFIPVSLAPYTEKGFYAAV